MDRLKGTGVAIVTPFRKDYSLDLDALRSVVNHCIAGGVDYLVVLGTTGETATLNPSEKNTVLRTVIDENNGRLPLVIGIGGNNTAQVAKELENTDLSDFEAVLSVSPYYNKPTQEGIYRHFKFLAEVSDKPIIVYNVPGRTASNILPSTVKRLAEDCPNILGIKEASGNMDQINEVIASVPSSFMVLSGDDFTALPTVLAGGAGVISVLAQGIPTKFSEMIRLGLSGATDEAYQLHHQLLDGMDLIFEEGNPAGIKAMLEYLKISEASVRLPLVEASPDLKRKIGKFVSNHVQLPA